MNLLYQTALLFFIYTPNDNKPVVRGMAGSEPVFQPAHGSSGSEGQAGLGKAQIPGNIHVRHVTGGVESCMYRYDQADHDLRDGDGMETYKAGGRSGQGSILGPSQGHRRHSKNQQVDDRQGRGS